MNRLIDIHCTNCDYRADDVWANAGEYPACPICHQPTERLWTSTGSVVGDDIPGGLAIEHGICHSDGSPKTYYTKSSIYKAAKAKGLHVGAFVHGSPSGRTWV
jgi:hypothetical protein